MSEMSRRTFIGSGAVGAVGFSRGSVDLREILAAITNGLSLRTSGRARLALAGISWVPEGPTTPVAGVRLRWFSPTLFREVPDAPSFPGTYIVERADLPVPLLPKNRWGTIHVGMRPLSRAPEAWWSPLARTPGLSSSFRPLSAAQAVTFLYHGPRTLCRLLDGAGQVVAELPVRDRQRVYYEAGEIAEVRFVAFGHPDPLLTDARALDLYAPSGLDLAFTEVARIDAAHIIRREARLPSERLNGFTSLSVEEWRQFADLAREAVEETTALPFLADILGAREALAVTIASRWEYAVLAGFGFYDGPRTATPRIDRTRPGLLEGTPDRPLVYRVRELPPQDHTLGLEQVSNLIFIPPGAAPELNAPADVRFEPGVVGVLSEVSETNEEEPTPPLYLARTRLSWVHPSDLHAIGIEVSDEIGASTLTGRPGRTDQTVFFATESGRLRRGGSVSRAIPLPFVDSVLGGTARSIDGWDRVSSWVTIPPPRLAIDFHPLPPPIKDCRLDESEIPRTVHLDRPLVEEPWVPDELLVALGGKVRVVARISPPTTLAVTAELANRLDKGRISVVLSGSDASALLSFREGDFVSGEFRGEILEVAGTVIIVDAPAEGDDDDGTDLLFSPGPATLVQSDSDPALWRVVATVPGGVTTIPDRITVADPGLPEATASQCTDYALQLVYSDLSGVETPGPVGNRVSALRLPKAPRPTPSFTAIPIGRDYYRRLGLAITLSSDADPADRFDVAWAPGAPGDYSAAGAFAGSALPGIFGAQAASDKRTLFALLEIGDREAKEEITVGIQSVSDDGLADTWRMIGVMI